MDVIQLRHATELVVTLNYYNVCKFDSLNIVGHFFSMGKKYGEMRLKHVDYLDRQQWEFFSTPDSPTFSLSQHSSQHANLKDTEYELLRKLRLALNREMEAESESGLPSILGFAKYLDHSVVFEILDGDTSTLIGDISYNLERKDYAFTAAPDLQAIEILDGNTSTRVGDISYDPQTRDYAFTAAPDLETVEKP